MFQRVLIANRGEIACRIAAVLRARGVASVAVYSEADAEAPHVRAADVALPIGPPPVAQSYLDAAAILDAARRAGADAIHPGYGLLSESAAFAERCAAAGLTFVGPPPDVIRAMGDKAAARAAAAAAGVPIVPGSPGPIADDADAARLASALGYPILVKAAAGGGGIGMSRVTKPGKLERALRACRDRGQRSFGDAAVYLEKLIAPARHVEVQILFDHHGHGAHLFERECTLQRRHQKVIEESPSPFVAERPALRKALTSAALRIARAIGYRNAGTVEFVIDRDGNFYFIEMNTRLQVEHPVTEAVTGVDLIGLQLEIAAGAPLDPDLRTVHPEGAALECRVYAEDPDRRFAPCPGRIGRFAPPSGPGLRVDAGVGPDQIVTPFYDPLLAKLIAHGPDRPAAIARARAGLAAFTLEGQDGLTTNLEMLHEVLGTTAFAAGAFDTGWLERYLARDRAGRDQDKK